MIGELNRRITIKSWATSQDAGGGSTPSVSSSFSVWAKVEDRTGAIVTGQGQLQWSYDYKITFRYDPANVVTSDETINYDSKELTINSISYENEGKRKFTVARCSTTNK